MLSTAPQLWLYITLKDAISGVKKKIRYSPPLIPSTFFLPGIPTALLNAKTCVSAVVTTIEV